MRDARDEQAEFRAPKHIEREWIAVLAPPLSWAFGLVAKYALVPFICGSSDTIWTHLVSIVTLIVAVAAGLLGWRLYGDAGREWPGESAQPVVRSRFMAALGLLSGTLFAIAIAAQWITSAFLNPCVAI
jgi:hypothetical protein